MKGYFFFIIFLFFSFVLHGEEPSLEIIKERLELQQRFLPGNWCLVPWNRGWCSSDIIAIEEEKVVVKVMDTSLPVSEWPIKVFDQSKIGSHHHLMTFTLEDLISDLRNKQILRSSFIEAGFKNIDRSWFCRENPYLDAAIDIGCNMCISSPHIHILSLELVKKLFPHAKKILDVGTGSGYMAAVLAYLAPEAQVYAIDCFQELLKNAQNSCEVFLPKAIGKRISFFLGNGEEGYKVKAPYDLIYVGFMCQEIPSSLVKQLKPGGMLLIPVANCTCTFDNRLWGGNMMIIEKDEEGIVWGHKAFSCSFVPTQKNNPEACLWDLDERCGEYGEDF